MQLSPTDSRGSVIARNTIRSPMAGNEKYNRAKYYSAIKTGFRHMQGNVGVSFLREDPPLPELVPLFLEKKFNADGTEEKLSSTVIVFSCWNTMAGSAVVSLPWAFQTAGLGLGMIISLVSFLVSWYTCYLIIDTTKKDKDYTFTLKKYFGKPGYYLGLLGPIILMFGAITVYFVVVVQSLYPLLVVLCQKVFKMDIEYIDPNTPPYYNFSKFSASWVALFEFVKFFIFGMKKDLSIFVKMGFLGSLCVISMSCVVIAYGFIAIGGTDYSFKSVPS